MMTRSWLNLALERHWTLFITKGHEGSSCCQLDTLDRWSLIIPLEHLLTCVSLDACHLDDLALTVDVQTIVVIQVVYSRP